jgi:hypothetical protein
MRRLRVTSAIWRAWDFRVAVGNQRKWAGFAWMVAGRAGTEDDGSNIARECGESGILSVGGFRGSGPEA